MNPRDPSRPSRRFTLPADRRIRRRADFQRVYSLRSIAAGEALAVHAAPNGRRTARVGLSVGRKHGGSVRRNRIRRLLREAFRLSRDSLPEGYDFILIPRKFGDTTLRDLLAVLPALATQAAKRADQKCRRPS